MFFQEQQKDDGKRQSHGKRDGFFHAEHRREPVAHRHEYAIRDDPRHREPYLAFIIQLFQHDNPLLLFYHSHFIIV